MRQMARFTRALLVIAMGAMWLLSIAWFWSSRGYASYSVCTSSRQYSLWCSEGCATVAFVEGARPTNYWISPPGLTVLSGYRSPEFGLTLPNVAWKSTMGNATVTWFKMPLWLPWTILLGATLLLFRRYREQRWPRGCCQNCGYSRKANVTGRCPECGEAVEATA